MTRDGVHNCATVPWGMNLNKDTSQKKICGVKLCVFGEFLRRTVHFDRREFAQHWPVLKFLVISRRRTLEILANEFAFDDVIS